MTTGDRATLALAIKIRRGLALAAGVAAVALLAPAKAQNAPAPLPPAKPADLTKPTLYAVGYAHLDTQWRWSYPQVVNQFLRNTLVDNFKLIDANPHYVFNFSGSRRYQLMKEYFPKEYARMAEYVKAGRWFPGGSNVDETDQNVPSAESVVRHVLYGNHYFKKEFGVAGVDFCVPDCFGFPYSLPSVLHHCSIKGFHTAKLRWGSAVGIPFNVGLWQGVDGETVEAAFDPTPYDSKVIDDLSTDKAWVKRAKDNGDKASGPGGKYGPASHVYADYRYYGTGDRGGAPAPASVKLMEKSVTDDAGPLRVIGATTDQMFRDITPAERATLPVYDGELLLTWHSCGSGVSQGYMKRWNRKGELLADAAERASVAATWLGATAYPTEKLYNGWMQLLESQMHDILPGDCLPVCYEYSWNDDVIALNSFAAAEQDAVGGVASALDTQVQGVPLVVYNPLSIAREDVVEASVAVPGLSGNTRGLDAATVYGPDGKAVPTQVLGRDGDKLKLLFLAKVGPVSHTSFEVRVEPPGKVHYQDTLRATDTTIENARYLVTLTPGGDVAQVRDKKNNQNLLKSPHRLGFLRENPAQFPAWNMDWEDRQQDCQQFVAGPAQIKVIEDGPVRVTLEVTRETRGSKFVQRIRLAAGDAGDRVEFDNHIDWQSSECSLEAVFPLTVSNPIATYDIQVGTKQRPNNDPKKYAVPQQQWIDVKDDARDYGVSILNDCKYTSDKPADDTIRLTMLYTPGTRGGYQDEGCQDFGKHEMVYALTGHEGNWYAGKTNESAARMNQPLVAFQTTLHAGPLGKSFSLLSLNTRQAVVQAVKKAEDSDEIIVRLKEVSGEPAQGVQVTFAAPVVSAREVDGQENDIGKAIVRDGKLVTDLKKYHLRAFAVKLAPPQTPSAMAKSTPVAVPFDTVAASTPDNTNGGAFDAEHKSYPADRLPAEIVSEGISFKMGPTTDGAKNAVMCHGQTLDLPAGATRVYLLASANTAADVKATFKVGDQSTELDVQSWTGKIGQWDNRLWKGKISALTYGWTNRLDGLVPGFIKRATVAWYADHRHDPTKGREVWDYCYLFKYGLDVPAGATKLTLPDDGKVAVFAVTATTGSHDDVTPVRPLYDTLADHVRDTPPKATVVSTPVATATKGRAGNFAPADPDAAVVYHDAIKVKLDRPIYFQDGHLHYTLDGSEPTTSSPAYAEPFTISRRTTVKARQFDAAGNGGPTLTELFDVDDTTPPTVAAVAGISFETAVRVAFSEPVDPATAETAANYAFQPPLKIKSAKLEGDHTTVALELIDPPGAGTKAGTEGTGTLGSANMPSYKLTVASVKDASDHGNVIKAVPVAVQFVQPVYQLASYVNNNGKKKPIDAKVAGLPTKAKQPWTINCFVRCPDEPGGMVVIAGFGHCDDGHMPSGTGRYLCKFDTGLQFWAREQDVPTDRALTTGNEWQMLTAVYDGKAVTLYKDGEKIGDKEVSFADDDESVIRVCPPDAWGKKNRFAGEVKDLTVWTAALEPAAVRMLSDSTSKHD